MSEYHKIDSIYKRDTTGKEFLWGQFSRPEFGLLSEIKWEFTEKVDGMNIRVWNPLGVNLTFSGKTDKANLPKDLVEKLTLRFDDLRQQKLHEIFGSSPFCLYGEGYGPGIQKGSCYREDKDFVLFDVRVGHWWLKREDVEEVGKSLGLDVVPIIGEGTLADMVALCPTLKSTWGDFRPEGIVARPKIELQDRAGKRIITKIKQRDFK